MTSTKSKATGEGLRCGGKTAANSKSIRGKKGRATAPRPSNSCAVKGSQIATPSPDDTSPHVISDRLDRFYGLDRVLAGKNDPGHEDIMNIIRNIRTPIMHRAVEANGFVFVGGTIADDTSVSMGEQTRNILGKIAGYLKEAGTDASRVVSASIFVTDLSRKKEMDAAWINSSETACRRAQRSA
jgi:2-iminobutanoate/2-iminopropanoate deaminase